MTDNSEDYSRSILSIDQIRSRYNQSKKTLKIAHVNVENLQVHRECFINLFNDGSFDIVAVTDTFLKPELSSLSFNLDGYVLFRHEREGKEGGRVAVYFKNVFGYKVIRYSRKIYCKKLEYIILELSLNWNELEVTYLYCF